MDDRATSSWRRHSDDARHDRGSNSANRSPPTRRYQTQILVQASQDEGCATETSTAPRRILIVDNDMGSADSVELILHTSGYPETRVAYSGRAALAMAAVFQPNLVLLDLSLLDMTGYELTQWLRAQTENRDLALIAMTSSPEDAARAQAEAAGFERYLAKPVARRDLLNLMASPYE